MKRMTLDFSANEIILDYPNQWGTEYADLSHVKDAICSLLTLEPDVSRVVLDYEREAVVCDGAERALPGLAAMEPGINELIGYGDLDPRELRELDGLTSRTDRSAASRQLELASILDGIGGRLDVYASLFSGESPTDRFVDVVLEKLFPEMRPRSPAAVLSTVKYRFHTDQNDTKLFFTLLLGDVISYREEVGQSVEIYLGSFASMKMSRETFLRTFVPLPPAPKGFRYCSLNVIDDAHPVGVCIFYPEEQSLVAVDAIAKGQKYDKILSDLLDSIDEGSGYGTRWVFVIRA